MTRPVKDESEETTELRMQNKRDSGGVSVIDRSINAPAIPQTPSFSNNIENIPIKYSVDEYLRKFTFEDGRSLFDKKETKLETLFIQGRRINKYVNEFWTSAQRQSSSIHEISYRACFKAQLPKFFINLLTEENDLVYDPFMGRGTTTVEAALLKRRVVGNDINPLSQILTYPRLNIADIEEVADRLREIPRPHHLKTDIDLSMFYHEHTASEIMALRNYLIERKESRKEDRVDQWIRMVATNRLSGHSVGFFSVYTLPPNQAVSAESQKKINIKRKQTPEYRNTHQIILKKTNSLLRTLTQAQTRQINEAGKTALLLTGDARNSTRIENDTVNLVVTSPPFLDIVQYSSDNWLRCWFNAIDVDQVSSALTVVKNIDAWTSVMGDVFKELFRIIKKGGWVAFEVGELKNGSVKLDEHVVPLGINAGFKCEGIVINQQQFTKTSNIWGVNNNALGTNTNRIVLFNKI